MSPGLLLCCPCSSILTCFSYVSAAVILVCYIAYKLYYRTSFVRTYNMDLVSGRRELNLEHLIAEERAEQMMWPMWKRIYKLVC